MKVNDGESGSSQESKPSANFCDAYLSYLSKNSARLPIASPTSGSKTSSDSTAANGVLQIGPSCSPGSKWTFYNRSSPQSIDLKLRGAHARKSSDRFADGELTGSSRILSNGNDKRFIGKEQLRVQIEQLDFKRKEAKINGKRISTGRKQLNLDTGSSNQDGKQFTVNQKQLKVSVELINLSDSFVKVDGEVIKVHTDQLQMSETLKVDGVEAKAKPNQQEEDQSTELSLNQTFFNRTSLNQLSFLPSLNLQPSSQSSVNQTSSAAPDFAAKDAEIRIEPSNLPAKSQSFNVGENCCETIDSSDASKDEKQLLAVYKDLDSLQASNIDKTQVIHEESTQCSLDRSEFFQVHENETCIELSDDDIGTSEAEETRKNVHKAERQRNLPINGVDVGCIRSNISAGVKIPGRLTDGGERCNFSRHSLRSSFKNSWRKKIVKKHLVSEKLKTQATRLLNAERPKRSVVAKKTDGASIGLSRREEVELTRALYASLQTQKQKNKPIVATAQNAAEDDVTEASHDGASQASSLFGRSNTYPCGSEGFVNSRNRNPEVQVQRKFASGPNSVAPVNIRKRGKRPGNILVSKKAKTEDFLTFLCLRERTVVPSLLDFIHGLQNMGSQNSSVKTNSSTVKLQNSHDQFVNDHPPQSEVQAMHMPATSKFSSGETPIEANVMKSSGDCYSNSEDPVHNDHSTGIEAEMAVDEVQKITALCAISPSVKTPSLTARSALIPVGLQQQDDLKNIDDNSSPSFHTLTVGSTLNPVGLQQRDDIDDTDDSSPLKSHSLISIKNSSKAAMGRVTQRKTNLSKSSSNRFRPSTRALTAARADEQLMRAKQRQSPVTSDSEDLTARHNSREHEEVSEDLTARHNAREHENVSEDLTARHNAREHQKVSEDLTARHNAREHEKVGEDLTARHNAREHEKVSEDLTARHNVSEHEKVSKDLTARHNAREQEEDSKDLTARHSAREHEEDLHWVEEVMDIDLPARTFSHIGITDGSHKSIDEDMVESGEPPLQMEIELLVEMEIEDCATSSKSSCVSEYPVVVDDSNDCAPDELCNAKKHASSRSRNPDLPQRRLLRARNDKEDLVSVGFAAKKFVAHPRSLRTSRNYSKDCVAQEPKAASDSDQLPNERPALGCHIPQISLSISFFPSADDPARIVNGPSYHPSEEQFEDPIQYVELIQTNAEPFGMCRVVPPGGWKVECCIPQELRFKTSVQYINRLRHRCGPNSFQMDCIKKHLESQKIQMDQFPLLNGIQVDLVALSKAVKQCGGLQHVIDKNTWSKVAKIMHLPKYDKDKAQRLCQIYCRFLLSYDTLNEDERQKLSKQVTGRRQPNNYDPKAHCFAKGKSRTLSEFFNVARNISGLYFDQEPTTSEVEAEYFRLLGEAERHVAVHMVHNDTEQCGSAFPEKKDSPYARHGWNFNVLRKNEGSLLNSLGRAEDVTSSLLHVGMLFSTSCWTRHRHYLPFIHYLHTGADIIWYCIPASETRKFQKFVENEIPNCKDLELGLEESHFMISPDELVLHGISVSRVVQRHGEYVIVFPESFTAYVCSGYSISESMYFATPDWIPHGYKAIQVLREKSVPEVFSLTKVLFGVTFTSHPRPDVLETALPYLQETIITELSLRSKVLQLGLSRTTVSHDEHVLCEICKTRCFLSAVVSEQDDVVYCLEHALSRLQKKKKINSYKMLYQFEEGNCNCNLEISTTPKENQVMKTSLFTSQAISAAAKKDLQHMLEKAIKISKKSPEME